MKYYVTADVHAYFTELNAALRECGYFEDTVPHKLIICGDLYDRGTEALQLQEFLLELLAALLFHSRLVWGFILF